ncbi:MAG: DUF929 family protein [Trebonia sp.]|jgi:thiol-disulfide isomerase/thioredoxin
MLGSGPEDGDIIEMSSRKPRLAGVIGGRSRLVLVAAGVCALVAAGATFAAVRLNSHAPANSALAKLITEVTTVPVSETVPSPSTASGGGAAPGSGISGAQPPAELSASAPAIALDSAPIAVSGPPLSADGKPEVLYVGTEYCPYCDAENWALIVALSRFGEFSGLSTSRSPSFENVPPVDGWTFYRSSYASRYLTFVPVETASNVLLSPKSDQASAASYRRLQRLTPAEQAVFAKLDPLRSTPFLDFGGKAVQVGTQVQPSALGELTWSEIAADLRRPRTAAGVTILASVDTLTAEICGLTGDRPAAVCAG